MRGQIAGLVRDGDRGWKLESESIPTTPSRSLHKEWAVDEVGKEQVTFRQMTGRELFLMRPAGVVTEPWDKNDYGDTVWKKQSVLT